MKPYLAPSLAIMALALSLPLGAAQPPNANIEYLRPADLGKPLSGVPGSPHGHVRQQAGYGKGYRYGHAVNGPMGDIIIWSPSVTNQYGTATPGHNMQSRSRVQVSPLGPRLQYKPEYGKSTRPGQTR
jgi:hypothetical protein